LYATKLLGGLARPLIPALEALRATVGQGDRQEINDLIDRIRSPGAAQP
jgi:hypothetical protein